MLDHCAPTAYHRSSVAVCLCRQLGVGSLQTPGMQPILATTLRWTQVIGLHIDWDKTWWWTSHNCLADSIRQAFESLQLPAVHRMLAVSDLGCPLRYQGAARMGKLADRLTEAKERLTRVKGLRADLDVKAKIIAASVYPVAFHGAELFPLGQQHTKSLRHHVAEALIGPSESMSAALVTLCPRPNTSKGPASTLKTYIARSGWTLDASGQLQVTSFIRLHLVNCSWTTLVWFAERAWQDKLLTVHSHRRALINFPNVDQHLTRAVLDKFNSKDRRLLFKGNCGSLSDSKPTGHLG